MPDIRATFDAATLTAEWSLLPDGTLATDRDLATAVVVSLFTDRTARADDTLPDGGGDRRGWWADWQAADIWGAGPIGSRLWLLDREKHLEDVRARADDYIREALAWMTSPDVRLAERVDIDVAWFGTGRLGATITVWRGPLEAVAVRFQDLWTQH